MLCGDLCRTESAGTDGSTDDILQHGNGRDSQVLLYVRCAGTENMVSETCRYLLYLGPLASGVEKSEECIHDRTGISFPLPGGTAGTGTWCLPDHFAGKAVVYPGTHRCGQNDVMSVSCCALRWRRNFRKNLLSDCKNDYPYGCRGSF